MYRENTPIFLLYFFEIMTIEVLVRPSLGKGI